MKLGLISAGGKPCLVEASGDRPTPLAFEGDVTGLIRSGTDPRHLGRHEPEVMDSPLRAPLRPGKIMAIGLNYADHVRETGADTPCGRPGGVTRTCR